MNTGSLIVIQSTPFCNIDCSYCYLPERTNTQRMSSDVLSAIFRRAFESPLTVEPITFLWHAGEPLVTPLATYEEAFELAHAENQSFHRKFDFAIQTNATLINAAWSNLFRRYKVQIGVSIDGPAFIHDGQRQDRSGRGTHHRVMEGVRHLKEAEIPFSAIAVLSDVALDHADAIFDFFVGENILNIAFNAESAIGVHHISSLASYARYERFFARFLELMAASPVHVDVREISHAYRALKSYRDDNGAIDGRNSANAPFDLITIDINGTYSTFCPELRGAKAPRYADFAMGNVLHDPFESMTSNPVFQRVNEEIRKGVAACRACCPYWFACFGGSPSSKYFESGSFDVTETSHCRYQKQAVASALIDHIERASNRELVVLS